MNITTLADITNAAGTHLAQGIRQLDAPVHPSIYHFHVYPFTITQSHRNIWREFLNTLTSNTEDKLLTPLGAWTTTPSTIRPYRIAEGLLFQQHSNKQWYRHQLSNTQQITRTTYRRYSKSIFYQQDLPSHNTIVDVDNRGEYLYVATIPLGNEDLHHHHHTGGTPPQSPVGHAQDFQAFLTFVRTKIAKFVTPSSAQAFYDRLFVDFQATHKGFHRLLQAIENGEIINNTTDGSKLDCDEASAGWLFWMANAEVDEDCVAAEDMDTTNGRRRILSANSILVDGRLQSNTSYRAEGTGKLAAVIVL